MLFNLLYELLSGTAVSTVICNLQVQVTNQVEDSMLTLYMQVENANCATSVVFFRLRSVQSAWKDLWSRYEWDLIVQSKYCKSLIIVSQLQEWNEAESNRFLQIDLLQPQWPILLLGSTTINIAKTTYPNNDHAFIIQVGLVVQQKQGHLGMWVHADKFQL